MGDAILGVIAHDENIVHACFGIAKDIDRVCEYISGEQSEHSDCWQYAPGSPSVKISIEYGALDVSTITSRFLGEQPARSSGL
jgi:hypothetical protein